MWLDTDFFIKLVTRITHSFNYFFEKKRKRVNQWHRITQYEFQQFVTKFLSLHK